MKRKKKSSTNKQSKQENQHQQNEFYKKMKQMMAQLGDVSAFRLFEKFDLFEMYYCRLRPYKIINSCDGQVKVSKQNLDLLNHVLSHMLHQSFVKIGKQQTQVCLYDFTVYLETIYLFYRNTYKEESEIAAKFLACFPFFDDGFEEIRLEVLGKISGRMDELAWLFLILRAALSGLFRKR